MRITYLCLVFWATGVFGNALTGPLQSVLVFIAYSMELEAFGVGNTEIAAGCRGSGFQGSCLFDEFFRHVDAKAGLYYWPGTKVGNDPSPAAAKAAIQLSISKYSNWLDPAKLLPNIFPKTRVGPIIYEHIFTEVVNRIQECRKELGDELETELSRCRFLMGAIHEGRLADQAPHAILAAQREFTKAGLVYGNEQTVDTKVMTGRMGTKWLEFDAVPTLRNHPKDGAAIRAAIKAAQKSDNNNSHKRAIKASQAMESRLWGPDSC